jgi:hypothetical protein
MSILRQSPSVFVGLVVTKARERLHGVNRLAHNVLSARLGCRSSSVRRCKMAQHEFVSRRPKQFAQRQVSSILPKDASLKLFFNAPG